MYKLILVIFIPCMIACNQDRSNKHVSRIKKLRALQQKDPFLFNTYCNQRFSYCIGYPVFLLFPGPEADNLDGRIFTDKNGVEVLRVFGKQPPYHNNDPVPLKELMEEDLRDIAAADINGELVITGKQFTGNSYIISGNTGSKMFYQKVVVKNYTCAYAILQYAISEKDTYSVIAGKILTSFK